jgi:HflK protein
MERNFQRLAMWDQLILLVASVCGFLVARYADSLAGQVSLVFFGMGLLVAAVSCFQMRLQERERLEKLEFDELRKSKGGSALFSSQDAESFPARRAREQFEKWFVPGFTFVLLIIQAGGAWLMWQWLQLAGQSPAEPSLVAPAIFGIFALVLFLMGKYSAGLARLEQQHLLRPVASYLLSTAYLSALVTLTLALASWGNLPLADLYVARALCIVLGLLAVETLFTLVLEVYRPRVRGRATRLLYDSRLVGLLGEPESLITTAAHALDYQFGFKVSETWFYQFLRRALAWILLAQVTVLFLSTCFVFVGTGEQALLERLGRPVTGREVLDPGPHLKLPWPIDKVYRYPTERLQKFNIGFVPDDDHDVRQTVLWTVSHYQEEFNLLVATRESDIAEDQDQSVPVNLLSVSIPVQYRIKDLKAWAYNHTDAGDLLEKIATREVIRYLLGVDLIEIMSSGREDAATALRSRIQEHADAREIGVEILFLGLQDIHPPVRVADAFQEVIGASQQSQAIVLEAEAHRARIVPLARAEANRIVREAESYATNRVSTAAAQADRFANQIIAHRAAPRVYPARLRLQTFARASQGVRKYLIASEFPVEVFQLNLEDQIRPDLATDLVVPPANER